MSNKKNNGMHGVSTVFRKECRENFRDRRAIFNTLLLGPILFPFMFIALVWFTTSAEQERAEKTLEIPVIGAELAPSLIRFLEQQGTVIKAPPDDPEAVVRAQQEMVVLRILPEYPEKWLAGEPAPVEVIADPSRQESSVTIRRVKNLLAIYGCGCEGRGPVNGQEPRHPGDDFPALRFDDHCLYRRHAPGHGYHCG
jgi:sodium transport system permease protein